MFENPWKKSQFTKRAKRAKFTFWVVKSSLKMPKWFILASFWKPETCGQTVLPDRSILIGIWILTLKLSFFALLGIIFASNETAGRKPLRSSSSFNWCKKVYQSCMNKFEAIKSSFNIAALIFNTTDTSLHNHSSATQNLRNSLFVRDENVL